MWFQNQNFGYPHGCLVGKYKPFGKKISFLAWKKTLNTSAQDLKIQWEINFLTFKNTDRNAPNKIFWIEIWTFSFKICFRNQFSTSGSGQTENTQIRVFAQQACFQIFCQIFLVFCQNLSSLCSNYKHHIKYHVSNM